MNVKKSHKASSKHTTKSQLETETLQRKPVHSFIHSPAWPSFCVPSGAGLNSHEESCCLWSYRTALKDTDGKIGNCTTQQSCSGEEEQAPQVCKGEH